MENALELAEKTYVNVNIHAAENADRLATLAQLPDSCVASADCLDRQRKVFEEHNVFSPAMIDGIIDQLRAYDDKMLRKNIENYPEEIQKLVTNLMCDIGKRTASDKDGAHGIDEIVHGVDIGGQIG